MNYYQWIALMESTDGLPRKVMTALDRSFRAIVCEVIRCEQERDFERSAELGVLASELENVIEEFGREFDDLARQPERPSV